MKHKNIFEFIILNLVRLIGLSLLLFSIIPIIHSIYTFGPNINRAVLGVGIKDSDSSIVISNIISKSGAEEAGLTIGDTILKVNGISQKSDSINIGLWGKPIVGEKVIITIKRGNLLKDVEVIKKPDTAFDKVITVLLSFENSFLMMMYTLVGLWGLFKKQFSAETILIAFVCFSFGTMLYAVFNFDPSTSIISESFQLSKIKEFLSGSFLFVPAFWLLLFLNFPEKNKFFSKHKISLSILIFILPLAAIFSGIFFSISKIFSLILTISNIIYFFFGILLGLVILIKTSKSTTNIIQKRQYRLIMFGIRFGVLSILFGWFSIFLYILLFKGLETFAWIFLPLFLLSQIGGLIIPFTFLNSFFKNRLLETEYALKKKVRYISATTILFVIYLIVIFSVGKLLIETFKITDSSLIIILVLLIAITYYPINKKFLIWIERKIYPEKTKYQESLKVFLKKLPSFIEIQNLLLNTSKWFEDIIGVRPAVAFAFDKATLTKLPFKPDNSKSIINLIKDGSNFFWDEIREKDNSEIDPVEKEWAINNNISITIPMVSYGELVGILNVGIKLNHEDFTGQDLDILKDATSQVALVLQNLRLQSEYIEKIRMDKELEVARTIQGQLLPHEIPQINGLNIFGKMRPCLEVAGDYLDIIPIGTDEVVLSVGDVSGKGAGAALLMSNLQAGLRSALRFTQDLSNIVFEINNIIHQNTNPAQFITFFICLWNYKNRTLEYVNAGHNPPILLKKIKVF